jgi:hypothetical protein
MNDNTKPQHPPQQNECPKTRLAEGGLAAVDVCHCGMMQLHIGALTLRITPGALSELLSTLGQAVAAHSARRFSEEGPLSALTLLRQERGEA